MSVLLVIPARYASTRYPGKALAGLTGATGVTKSLIQRSWEAAQAVSGMARVVVATDDGNQSQPFPERAGQLELRFDDCCSGRIDIAHEIVNLHRRQPFRKVVSLLKLWLDYKRA